MSTAKHTPGPWTAVNHSWCDTSISAPSTDNAICRLDINHATEESQDADEDQMAANANLIAAAPDLLALLVELVDIEGPMPGTSAWGDKARDAIAKATGGKP